MEKFLMKYLRYLRVIILLIVAMPVFAKTESNLYSSAVPVQSRSATDRNTALSEALSEVLIKVSGNSTVATLPRVHEQLKHTDQILRSYRYQSNDDDKYPYLLTASFEPNAVNSLLTANHQAIWGADRPALLFWVVKNENNQPTLISSDDASIYQTLTNTAALRGLPVVSPLLDLTDLNALSADDIIKNQDTNIINASQRYPHAGIVTVIISKADGNQWQSVWMLELNGQRTQFEIQAANAKQATAEGLNQLADNIATSYSVLHLGNGSAQLFQLEVYGISSTDDYAKVSQYLKNLSSVKQVTITKVMPSSVIYNVEVSGGKQLLQQSISIDDLLEPYNDVTVALDNSNLLSYRVRS